MYKYTSYTKRPLLKLALPFCIALAYGPSTAMAATILGSDLASFAVLGGSTVINTGATTLNGQMGTFPGLAITGQETVTINGQPALTTGAAFVHSGNALAIS